MLSILLGILSQYYINFLTNECKLPFQTIDIQSIYTDPNILLKQLHNLSEYGILQRRFVCLIKLHIIYDYAIKNQFQNICFGQNGQRLVADLLSKERGLSLQSATKYNYLFIYPINQNKLQIFHPLKDLLNKDILYNLRLKSNIKFPLYILGQHLSNALKNKPAHGNIDHLLEQFIDKLQEGFPSTTFTVLSSADKITLKPLLQQNFYPFMLRNQRLSLQSSRSRNFQIIHISNQKFSNQQIIQEIIQNIIIKFVLLVIECCNLQSAQELEQFTIQRDFLLQLIVQMVQCNEIFKFNIIQISMLLMIVQKINQKIVNSYVFII